MDFKENSLVEKIEKLAIEKLSKFLASYALKEEINQENINTIVLEIDSENALGLVIIYEDGFIYFDYLNKVNVQSNINWSEKAQTTEGVLASLSDFIEQKIK